MSDPDPTVVRSLAITAADLVAAVEAQYQRDADVVLRATPPFSGRMRARLHVEGADDADALTVDPTDLLADDAPAYPHPNETEDALRADPDAEYSVERHRERHEAALDEWRTAVPEHVREHVVVETAAGEHEVDVKVLG